MFLHFAVSVFPLTLTDLTSHVLRNSPSANALATKSAAVRRPAKASFIVGMGLNRVRSKMQINSQSALVYSLGVA